MAFTYWFWLGTTYLLILTWQDYKNKTWVDDRRNWFMLGISVSLISHVPSTLFYKLGLALVLSILYMFMKKVKAVGEADINSISWIFLGFGLIDVFYLLFFAAVFAVLTLIFIFLKQRVLRIYSPVAYYGVILLAFVFTCGVLKLY